MMMDRIVTGSLSADQLAAAHQPSKDFFRKLARERYGWSDVNFDAWWGRHRGKTP